MITKIKIAFLKIKVDFMQENQILQKKMEGQSTSLSK